MTKKMRSGNKIFAITLLISVLLHIGFLAAVSIPSFNVQPIEYEPVEIVLEEPPVEPEPEIEPLKDEEDKKEADEPVVADKADNDYEVAVTQKDVLPSKSLSTPKNNRPNNNDSGSIFGPNKPITNRVPKPLSDEEKKALLAKNGEKKDNKTSLKDEENTQKKPQQNAGNETGNKNETVTNTPLSEKAKQSGRIKPREGLVVPFPRNAKINYGGALPGNMTFNRTGDNYKIVATLNVPWNKIILKSEGRIVGNKFLPTKYTDTRKGKLYAHADFDYEKNVLYYGKEHSKKEPEEIPMEENSLDILSAAWQLAMNNGKVLNAMQVTTGKSPPRTYTQSNIPSQLSEYNQGEGRIMVRKLSLPTRKKTIYGLAVDFGYFPATISFDGYELAVDNFTLDGVDYWKAQNKGNKLKSAK